VTIRPEVGATRVAETLHLPSCMMRVCSSGKDFGKGSEGSLQSIRRNAQMQADKGGYQNERDFPHIVESCTTGGFGTCIFSRTRDDGTHLHEPPIPCRSPLMTAAAAGEVRNFPGGVWLPAEITFMACSWVGKHQSARTNATT
jgi:hypothetical protein